ncbi:unnamed protein product [Prorocentrum cordatum]|uniref:Uncharacterized protein n=1 Tax=Prorocentrum cordatum TaxID=2364126 RepID=A0ABN9VEN9_9DINO|nr:unnamed protein product [Polarella glacialis]
MGQMGCTGSSRSAPGHHSWQTELAFTDVIASSGSLPQGKTPRRAQRTRSAYSAEPARGKHGSADPCPRRHSCPAVATEDVRFCAWHLEHATLRGLLQSHSGPLCVVVEPGSCTPFSISEAGAVSMPSIPEEGALAWCADRSFETRRECRRELAKIWRQHSPGETVDLPPLGDAIGKAEWRQALHTEAQAPEEEEEEEEAAEACQQARRSTSASSTESSRQRSLLCRARQLLPGATAEARGRSAAKPCRRRVLPAEPAGQALGERRGPRGTRCSQGALRREGARGGGQPERGRKPR